MNQDDSNFFKTAPSKLRGNRVHLRLNRLCAEWMKKHRPGVVARLRVKAKREEAGR